MQVTIYKSLIYLWLFCFSINFVKVTIGDSVQEKLCTKTEKYNDTEVISEKKPVRVLKYEWCMSTTFKCSKYVTEIRNVEMNVTTEKSRTVPSCCPGFEEREDGKCSSKCLYPHCDDGGCNTPSDCSCDEEYALTECSVHNSTCSRNKQCACRPGFIITYDKIGNRIFCLPEIVADEMRCDTAEQCLLPSHRCIHNKCTRCLWEEYSNSTNKCTCPPGYFRPTDGSNCKFKVFGLPCNFKHSSSFHQNFEAIEAEYQGLTCLNGHYHCKNPLQRTYNNDINKCVSHVGEPCDPSDYTLDDGCQNGSSCIAENLQNNKYVCKCNEGRFITPDGNCALNLNASCENEPLGCNNYAGLVCSNSNKCECISSKLKFDPLKGKCLSPEGFRCGNTQIHDIKVHIECQTGLECRKGSTGLSCEK